eukprot:TRINITY_DN2349_c0_g2_i1.p1 TRINITY_DN2349_c0_g2~~TRINITY_DN2349_c0_g2_i1.p1  ORF type:complete len:495 (+),score=56.13 TRINITY_DN2349_c0_g2_i1:108-1487(+)
MIVGTGVFNLPYAFHQSGVILGSAVLLVSALMAWFCLVWMLEIMARTEGVNALQEEGELRSPDLPPNNVITTRKWDLSSIGYTFGGMKAKVAVQICIVCFSVGVLWAYAAVFASSVASLFFQFALGSECNVYSADISTGCNIAYYCSLVLYACFVVPLACMDVGEQIGVQVFMTLYRFSAFAVMLVTLLVAIIHGSNPNVPYAPGQVSPHPGDHLAYTTLVEWSGFAGIFSTSAIALNFHYTLPDLVTPLRDKSKALIVTTAALCVSCAIYIVLGALGAIFFGPNTQSLSTLNWSTYTGVDGGWGGPIEARAPWSVAIQVWVMLFPIFDMLSIFPLVAVVLGNNLLTFAPQSLLSKFGTNKVRVLFRLISSIPPILMATVVRKINIIFSVTGLFAFGLEFFIPAASHYFSKRFIITRWGELTDRTMYTKFVSHNVFVLLTVIFGVSAFGFSVAELFVSA